MVHTQFTKASLVALAAHEGHVLVFVDIRLGLEETLVSMIPLVRFLKRATETIWLALLSTLLRIDQGMNGHCVT